MTYTVDPERFKEMLRLIPGGESLAEHIEDDSVLDEVIADLDNEILPVLAQNFGILTAVTGAFMPRVLYFEKDHRTDKPEWALDEVISGQPSFRVNGAQAILEDIERNILSAPEGLERVAFWVNGAITIEEAIESPERTAMLMVHAKGASVFALARGRFISLRLGSVLSRAFFDIGLKMFRDFENIWEREFDRISDELILEKDTIAEALGAACPPCRNLSRDEWLILCKAITMHPLVQKMCERFLLDGVDTSLCESNNASYALGELTARLKKSERKFQADLKKATEEARASGVKRLQHTLDNSTKMLKGATERANRLDQELRDARKVIASGAGQTKAVATDKVVEGLARFF